jgi:23S rRNA (adenine2503-C2)-methyltransferase
MDFRKVQDILTNAKVPAFRIKQFKDSFAKGAVTWDEIKGWPKDLVQLLSSVTFFSWQDSRTEKSTDGTVKALLTLKDNSAIETVLIETKPDHLSVCISCEVGCPMACSFCATGKLGFKRRLTGEEIADQVLFWKIYLKEHMPNKSVKSIVFMGMGEPFHNTEAVFEAISWINTWYEIGMRRISVSTCGIPDGINSLADFYPQVNLAISLHGANEILRKSIMPIAGAIPLEVLIASVNNYMQKTHRQVMFEYLLMDGVNDLDSHIDEIRNLMYRFPLQLVHVNLIRYNETNSTTRPTPASRIREIKDWLIGEGISASIRKSTGADIDGACGQLAARAST